MNVRVRCRTSSRGGGEDVPLREVAGARMPRFGMQIFEPGHGRMVTQDSGIPEDAIEPRRGLKFVKSFA